MKKSIYLAILSVAFGLNAYSQTVITNDYSSSSSSIQSQKFTSDEDIQEQGSDLAVSYHAIEDGWGISMDWVMSYFVMGYGMYFGDKGDYISTNDGFEIYAGGNYRYHLTKNLYFDARVLGGYYSWTLKMKGKGSFSAKQKVTCWMARGIGMVQYETAYDSGKDNEPFVMYLNKLDLK